MFECALEREEDGDLPGARDAYLRALELDSRFAEAHYNLGNLLLGANEPRAAEEHFRAAADLEPDLACAWYHLGQAQAELGHCAEAAASLARALNILPTCAEAHFRLALCLEELGRRLDAARHWLAFLRLDPQSDWAEIARNHLRT